MQQQLQEYEYKTKLKKMSLINLLWTILIIVMKFPIDDL